ncbi:MAG: biotin--[acetyl-CoA-carboxylase] ligase [Acidobacteriota bacterium]
MKKPSKISPDKHFPPILKVVRLKECTSTNDYIKENITALENKSPLLVTAENQTKGKGRENRKWHSFPGKGLYSSFLFRFPIETKINFLSLAAGIAAAESINSLTGISPELKWPNDIEFRGKKIGGILIENLIGKDFINSISGIGINISCSRNDFPAELSGSAISILEITGKKFALKNMNIKLSSSLLRWVTKLREGETETIMKKYSGYMKHKKGDEVTFHQTGENIKGHFAGLDKTGGIIIRLSNGKLETFYSGEISTATSQIIR